MVGAGVRDEQNLKEITKVVEQCKLALPSKLSDDHLVVEAKIEV